MLNRNKQACFVYKHDDIMYLYTHTYICTCVVQLFDIKMFTQIPIQRRTYIHKRK